MKLFKKAKKGFTLVELVVVIAVIAILAGVSVGAYFGVTTSANNSACEQEAKAFHTNLLLVANDPANDTKVNLTKDGIVLEGTYTKEQLVKDVFAYAGLTENHATVQFNDVNPVDNTYESFSYKTSANVTRTVTISTGAFATVINIAAPATPDTDGE